MIIKNEAGEDVEVFTKEELEVKTQEEAERIASEKQEEIDRITAEKKEVEESLNKEKEKDKNFGKVRKQLEEKDQANEEVKKQIEELNKKLDTIARLPVEDTKADFIKSKIGDDKEKKDLFEYYFKRLGAEAKTKEEVLKASQEALVLVTGGEYKPNLDSIVISTGTSFNYRESDNGTVSDEAKSIAKMFGNSEKDLQEYKKKKGSK